MQNMYLAMYGDKVSISNAVFISIFAMIVVFVVLLIISFMIDITAAVLKVMAKKEDVNRSINKNSLNKKTDIGGTADIAIIAAAIATYLGTNANNIKIKKIRRIKQ